MKSFFPLALIAVVSLAVSSCEQDNRIGGCTDPFAINFDKSVLVSDDDGSCVYPPEVRRALLYKVTATWCPPCGDWGTNEFKTAVEGSSENAVVVAFHAAGDPMHNSMSDEIENDYGVTGYPTLVVNHEQDFGSASPMVNAVNTFVSEPADVSAVSIMEIVNNKIEITAQARWFEEMTGQMYCSIYILEDGISEPQATPSGYDEDYIHDFVFRTSASGTPFGDQVLNGSAWVGKTENLNYTLDLDPNWKKENLYAITVLWKRDAGGGYDFVNAYRAIVR
jgi:thiol-disulfide isomerase/thioredoxin